MSSEIILTIPRVPPSYSQIIRMKVSERIRMKILWRQEIKVAVMDLTSSQWANFKKGFKEIVISQHRRALIRDKDNLWASVKPILDALKHSGLIIDDDIKHIDLNFVWQARVKENSDVKTVIMISDPKEQLRIP